MKKIVYVLMFISINYCLNAQSWCKTGATWYYGWQNGYTKHQFIGAATIASVTCEKIERTDITFNAGATVTSTPTYYYTKTSGSLITLYNTVTTLFDTLYNFNANIGDSWSFPHHEHMECSKSKMTVTDTGHIVVSGINLKFQKVNVLQFVLGGSFSFSSVDTVFERIGNKKIYLFDEYEACPWYTDGYTHAGFRCYTDIQIPSFKRWSLGCDYVYLVDGINEIKNEFSVSISPNPVNTLLSINAEGFDIKSSKIVITNSIGKIMLSVQYLNQIDISQFNNGVYFIKIFDEFNHTLIKKIIKN